MKYHVTVNSVCVYEGRSHDRALEVLQDMVSVVRAVKGTGWIRYANASSKGQIIFTNGEDSRDRVE